MAREALIPEFPNYKVMDNGKVYSCYLPKTNTPSGIWRELEPVLDKSSGYYLVTLCHEGVRKNKRIHRLLAEAFIPNPARKAHVNHIDGNKLNNALVNLEWNTSSENSQHAMDNGLSEPVLEATRKAILMYEPDEVTFIREYRSFHDAMRDTGIAYQNISKVCRGLRRTAGGYHWKYKEKMST